MAPCLPDTASRSSTDFWFRRRMRLFTLIRTLSTLGWVSAMIQHVQVVPVGLTNNIVLIDCDDRIYKPADYLSPITKFRKDLARARGKLNIYNSGKDHVFLDHAKPYYHVRLRDADNNDDRAIDDRIILSASFEIITAVTVMPGEGDEISLHQSCWVSINSSKLFADEAENSGKHHLK